MGWCAKYKTVWENFFQIDNEVSIVGTNPDEIPFCEKTIIEHVEHHMRLFRKCKTVNLFITVQSIDCDDLFNIEYILKNIFFDKIQVTLKCGHDDSDRRDNIYISKKFWIH